MYDAINRTLSTLIEDENQEFIIKDYDRDQKVLEYDEEKVRVDY